MASHDQIDPDGGSGTYDPDYGSSSTPTRKEGAIIADSVHEARSEQRSGARELDVATERLPGLTRAQRDLNRAYPRSTVAPVERRRRALPTEIELRRGLSARQRNARSATKRRVLDEMPKAQYNAMHSLVTDPQHWEQTNNSLSAVAGDAVELDDKQRRDVQRVDRAIQRYERESGREHVVYTAVSLPEPVIDPKQLPESLHPGTTVSFDRFTASTHSLHEIDPVCQPTDAVFEIQTTRGMYMGRSARVDNSHHLLPRGIELTVLGAHFAPYERPGQPPGERLVIQLSDRS